MSCLSRVPGLPRLLPAILACALCLALVPLARARGVGLEPETERAARLQTLLARANFSPGLIDGKPGRKTRTAIEEFQRAGAIDVTGVADATTLAALATAAQLPSDAPWTTEYLITEADKALITGPIPEDWNERAALDRSGYIDMLDLLAERGWCSTGMVLALNPDLDADALNPGDRVTLPEVRARPIARLDRLRIELENKLVLGLDADGRTVFLTHCSIAAQLDKRPVGELKVKVVALDPDYTFDPKYWPEVTNVDRRLRIAPGPRNPVGAAWIGLDRPGYGVHGTVRPQDIGKTGSHGCFRLTNWDAARLARAVRTGMPVLVAE